MILQEFYENLMTFFSNLLLTPMNFFTAFTTFLFVIVETIGIFFSVFLRYLNLAVNCVPVFVRPFLILILSVRMIKFLLKRGNSIPSKSTSIYNGSSEITDIQNRTLRTRIERYKLEKKHASGGK